MFTKLIWLIVVNESLLWFEKYVDKNPGVVVKQFVGISQRTLWSKTNVSPNTLSSTDVPSKDNPFSQPTTRVLNTDSAEFLLILKAFSNF